MTIAARLPPEIEQRLQTLAEQTGRSKASFVREAILRFLEDLEDEQLALKRLRKQGKRWTLDDLESRNDLFARFDEWASEADTQRGTARFERWPRSSSRSWNDDSIRDRDPNRPPAGRGQGAASGIGDDIDQQSTLASEAIVAFVEDQERQLARIREGIADAEAGRVVGHEEVARWMDSWGADDELPPR